MMRTLRGASFGVAASLLAMSCASTGAPELTPGDPTASPSVRAPGKPAPALRLGVTALSRDPRGVPRMLRAVDSVKAPAGSSAEAAARFHVARIGAAWFDGGKPADLELVAVHKIRGGASIVRLAQKIEGTEVWGGELRVLVNADGSLHMVSGERYAAGAKVGVFAKAMSSAASVALRDHYGVAIGPNTFAVQKSKGAFTSLVAPPRTDLAIESLHSKRVWLPVEGELKAAHSVIFVGSKSGPTGAMHYFVDAERDSVLRKVNLTYSEANTYRVFADNDAEGRPFDGPIADFTPHPAGTASGRYPDNATSNLITVEGRNNPEGATKSDPWLPDDATSLIGNHVQVHTDQNGDNEPDAPDILATESAPNRYDYAYDQSKEPGADETQMKAGLTQLFYTINWLHDYWYDRGFNEAAGNAQVENFGRGGVGEDPIIAHAHDGSLGYPENHPDGPDPKRNNANMLPLPDGLTPLMQMYLWTNREAALTATPGGVVDAAPAQFGGGNYNINQAVVLVDDGSTADMGTVNDGCQAIGGAVAGKIALVDRGGCFFVVKAQNAQAAGATGLIIANNVPGDGAFSFGGPDASLTIPTLMTSFEAGAAMKDALGRGAVTARMVGTSEPERDGALDNMVVAHEWGHYFHHRLTVCGTPQCQAMSEGWGDFLAMHLIVRRSDAFEGTYAMGIYDTRRASDDAAYFGIRRYPYSTNLTKNPLTFQHIGNKNPLPNDVPRNGGGGANAEVHAAGEVWAQMLWEAYRALIAAHGYDEARTRMAEYVVAGLLAHPSEATYTEARDALLEVASMADVEDMKVMAAAFAKRGAGTCAVSPPLESETFDEVVESKNLAARFESSKIIVNDGVAGCDRDGHLDPGETGTVTVTLINKGAATAADVTATATTTVQGVTIEPATVASLEPFKPTDVSFRVTVADTVAPGTKLALQIVVQSTDACDDYNIEVSPTIGVDEQPNAAIQDDFNATTSPWQPGGTAGIWSRDDAGDGEFMQHGENPGALIDAHIASPLLKVGNQNLAITLKHRYALEGDGETNYDGGVIEVSTDGGTTWADITTLGAAPKYGAAIEAESPNALAGRPAYSGRSSGFPDFATETFVLGKKLAGKDALLRFRIGTDLNTSGYGWDIANISFEGLKNMPFTAVLAEGGNCKAGVGVDAGPAHEVYGGTTATLYGTTSVDAPQVAWTVVDGDVTLKDADKLTATFDAPDVDEPTEVTLRLTVNNGPAGALSDDVVIMIVPVPSGDDDDGCGCRTTSPAGAAGMLLPLAALAFAMRRRRRA